MGMEHFETLLQYAERTGRKPDTVYRFARRKFPALDWSVNSSLTPELISALSGKHTPEKSALQVVRVPRVPKEVESVKAEQIEQAPALLSLDTMRKTAISVLLFCVVIGHAGLVWYDLATIWGTPGTIGGGLMFAVMLAALGFASDPYLTRTSSAALWFVALLDIAAYFVHFEVFHTTSVNIWFTRALCAIICACSWVSLYFFRDSKLD